MSNDATMNVIIWIHIFFFLKQNSYFSFLKQNSLQRVDTVFECVFGKPTMQRKPHVSLFVGA